MTTPVCFRNRFVTSFNGVELSAVDRVKNLFIKTLAKNMGIDFSKKSKNPIIMTIVNQPSYRVRVEPGTRRIIIDRGVLSLHRARQLYQISLAIAQIKVNELLNPTMKAVKILSLFFLVVAATTLLAAVFAHPALLLTLLLIAYISMSCCAINLFVIDPVLANKEKDLVQHTAYSAIRKSGLNP